jgi:prepilin-type processing-associated H-X9-DG protein
MEYKAAEGIMYAEAKAHQLTYEVHRMRYRLGARHYRLTGWHRKPMRFNAAFMDGHAAQCDAEPHISPADPWNVIDMDLWPYRNNDWNWVAGYLRHWGRFVGFGWTFAPTSVEGTHRHPPDPFAPGEPAPIVYWDGQHCN